MDADAGPDAAWRGGGLTPEQAQRAKHQGVASADMSANRGGRWRTWRTYTSALPEPCGPARARRGADVTTAGDDESIVREWGDRPRGPRAAPRRQAAAAAGTPRPRTRAGAAPRAGGARGAP